MRFRRPGRQAPAPQPAEPTPEHGDVERVVADYAAQAHAADQLAAVDASHLEQPTANPNTLHVLAAERDTTAAEQLRLDYECRRRTQQAAHERTLDRHRAERRRVRAFDARADRAVAEGLADAEEAAAELGEVRAFERAASPASATRRLMAAVRGWRREEFAYAIAGSALSAVGVAALVTSAADLPWWAAGLIAGALEVVLTVRVIRLIGQRAELAEQHKGVPLPGVSDGARALVFLTRQIVALLAVSVLLNLTGLVAFDTSVLGALGALGAGGAALASWSAWQASVAAAATVRSNIATWQAGDWAAERAALRQRAAGAHIPDLDEPAEQHERSTPNTWDQVAVVRRALEGVAEERLAVLSDRGIEALAAMLAATPPGGGTPVAPGGGTPGGTPLEPGVEPLADQQDQVEPLDGRRAVLDALAELGVQANNSEIGRRIGLSRTSVRKHRIALAEEGLNVFPSGSTTDTE